VHTLGITENERSTLAVPRGQVRRRMEEAIFVKSQKCPYHATLTLTLSTPWMRALLVTIMCKFGGDPALFLVEEAICANVYRQTDGRTPHDCISSWRLH